MGITISTARLSYLKKPFNPYKELYDSDLQEYSERETQQLAQEDKDDKRADWRFQRARRNVKPPTDEDILLSYGLRRELRQVPRESSGRGRDSQKLLSSNVVADHIGLVVTYRETIRRAQPKSLPCVFYIHGGGRYGGTPYSGLYLKRAAEWARNFNAIIFSVDYRLSPNELDESPTGEEPTNDCFDALKWVYCQLGADGDEVLRYGDQSKLVVLGTSAGGGLAVSTVMKWCREREQGPKGVMGILSGLILEAPQLDDRCNTASHRRFTDGNMFVSGDAIEGWKASLGSRRGSSNVSIFEAPARARKEDVENFPPTYIEVGAVEPFKDEVKDFYKVLLTAGVPVELRLWRGCFHGFFAAAPDVLVSRLCNLSKLRWLSRRLGTHVESIETEYQRAQEEYDAKADDKKGLSD
ncbi:Alpha/Beta hydrolase protein [Xylariaceae sp. FL0594]|nr:Alpha/Beta hydrolase protein [Xylariaceae sp. FL0594]